MRRIGPRGASPARHLRAATEKDAARAAATQGVRRGITRTFADLLATQESTTQILDELAAFACGTWGWSRPRILRHNPNDGGYSSIHARGQDSAAFVPQDHPLLAALTHRRCALRVEDLEDSHRPEETTAAALCRENEWDVCVPLLIDDALPHVLMFGRGERGQPSAADLEILDAMTALAGAAIVRARAARELQLGRDSMHRAERLCSLGTLSAGVAHEIRNQMVAIQTFLQLLPERRDDEEFLTSFWSLANDEAKRIASLVSELLAFARTGDNGDGHENVNDLVERTATILQAEAKKAHVRLTLDLGENLPELFGNGDKIRQVLTNLILNAIQATPPEGSVRVLTRHLRLGEVERIRIEIQDSGPGISNDRADQVFAPFFTTKPQGTGLGLAISRGIVREHRGDIYVESPPGGGATFIIELPAHAGT